MKSGTLIACAHLLSLGAYRADGATLLTFDELVRASDAALTPVMNGYGGLDWNQFLLFNGSSVSAPNWALGYLGATYNATSSICCGALFDFTSAYVFPTVSTLRVQGLIGTNIVYDNLYDGSGYVNFNYLGINKVQFLATNSDGGNLYMDNVTININCSTLDCRNYVVKWGQGARVGESLGTCCLASNVVAIAAGGYNSLLLKEDGTLAAPLEGGELAGLGDCLTVGDEPAVGVPLVAVHCFSDECLLFFHRHLPPGDELQVPVGVLQDLGVRQSQLIGAPLIE